MLTLEKLPKNIFNELNKHTNILLFLISEDMDILDIPTGFEKYKENFINLSNLITYTHKTNFLLKVQECIKDQCTLSFGTNFSYDSNDVENIPQSFTLILHYQEKGKILVLADPICSLSHNETKNYFSMINDFSFLLRKSQKLEYTLIKKNEELNEKIKIVEYLTDHDSLTQIYSRKRIFEELKHEYNRYIRFLEPFCVVMLDIDFFKKVNDNYGHQNGDIVLREFSQKIKSLIREYDLIGRFGGEEFLVILPKTELKSAHKLMNRILKEISNFKISLSDKKNIQITCSAGIVQSDITITMDQLIMLSDTQLYKAKENGRNQVQ